ncbi:MAG: hypothetical protein ACI935_000305 [Moritella dasanensis]|jgi:hypothetical protein
MAEYILRMQILSNLQTFSIMELPLLINTYYPDRSELPENIASGLSLICSDLSPNSKESQILTDFIIQAHLLLNNDPRWHEHFSSHLSHSDDWLTRRVNIFSKYGFKLTDRNNQPVEFIEATQLRCCDNTVSTLIFCLVKRLVCM